MTSNRWSNDWNGDRINRDWNNENWNNNNWNKDWNGDWDGHDDHWNHYGKPWYGYGHGYHDYYHHHHNDWYWPLIGLAWGLTFGHGPYYGYGYGGGYPYYGGYGYGGGGYIDYGYAPITTYYAAPVIEEVPSAPQTVVEQSTPAAPAQTSFVAQGEAAFRAGQYQDSVKAFRHALVEDPNNGAYLMILGQALFATGEYREAAGATQQAARMLPQDKWGTIVVNYNELYSDAGVYTAQLRALEKARNDAPNDPAIRFLLGWHYGYLGYKAEAVRELDKTLEVIPTDAIAKSLRDSFAPQAPSQELPAPIQQ